MIRKYHNHKPKTNPWHREEEPHNHHETPERQTKQSNQLSLQIQIVLTFQAFVRPSLYSQIGHLLAFFILCCKHMAKHDIHMFGETGEMTFITGEQGTKVKFWVAQGTKAILGNMEHRKTIFDYWGTGKQAYLFQGNKGTVIPLGGSHKRSNFQTIHQFVCLFISLSTRHIKLCLWSTDSMYVKTCILIVLCILFKHTL